MGAGKDLGARYRGRIPERFVRVPGRQRLMEAGLEGTRQGGPGERYQEMGPDGLLEHLREMEPDGLLEHLREMEPGGLLEHLREMEPGGLLEHLRGMEPDGLLEHLQTAWGETLWDVLTRPRQTAHGGRERHWATRVRSVKGAPIVPGTGLLVQERPQSGEAARIFRAAGL